MESPVSQVDYILSLANKLVDENSHLKTEADRERLAKEDALKKAASASANEPTRIQELRVACARLEGLRGALEHKTKEQEAVMTEQKKTQESLLEALKAKDAEIAALKAAPPPPAATVLSGVALEEAQMKIESLQEALQKATEDMELLMQERMEVRERAETAEKKLEERDRELNRLRQHLLEQEEAHTQEILEIESRAEQLTKDLSAERETSARVATLSAYYEELQGLYRQKEEECQRFAIAANNLQAVVEQMQADQEQAIARETRPLRAEIELAKAETRQTVQKLARITELERALFEAHRTAETLRKDVSDREQTLAQLRSEVEPLRATLNQMATRLQDLTRHEESSVDKRIVKQLIVTFFSKAGQRQDVMELMAKILDFTPEERVIVGMRSSTPGTPTKGNPSALASQRSLSELWVEFLLQEAGDRKVSKTIFT